MVLMRTTCLLICVASARAAGGKWLRNLVTLRDVVLDHPVNPNEGWDHADSRMGYVSDIRLATLSHLTSISMTEHS